MTLQVEPGAVNKSTQAVELNANDTVLITGGGSWHHGEGGTRNRVALQVEAGAGRQFAGALGRKCGHRFASKRPPKSKRRRLKKQPNTKPAAIEAEYKRPAEGPRDSRQPEGDSRRGKRWWSTVRWTCVTPPRSALIDEA